MAGKKLLLLILVFTQLILIASPSLHSPQSAKALTTDPINSPADAVAITGPLRKSSANPRYFAGPNGNIVYLTGSHTWCNFMDCDDTNPITATFDYPAFLNFLTARNHHFFRLWRAENARGGEAGPNFWFNPMPYQRSGTCCAFDGGNKFDLNKFNQAYFDRMRQRVIDAGNKGIYVSIMLFDGWSVESKFGGHNPWDGHPYHVSNNINGVDGDLNGDNQGGETHTLSNSQVTALQEAYIRKVIDSVNDLDNVLYEISNESTGSTANTNWQYHMINYIKNYEASKAKQHPVGMTATWPNYASSDLYNSPADWISLGSNVNIDTYAPPIATGSKVILADTDHLCGICGNRQWVWKSFTRGENPMFMDVYNFATSSRGAYLPPTGNEVDIRNNLGYTRSYALRMNLAAMTPQPGLCSSGFCLAKATASTPEYLAYLPSGGSININLNATSATLNVEWFNPSTGTTTRGGTVNGGANRSLSAPFSGDAVLYLTTEALPTFSDVPPSHPYFNDIEILYANKLTGGCSTTPLKYCPDQIMNRAESAVFMMRGTFGSGYNPNPAQHLFHDDWSKGTWARDWAESMREAGMTAGCKTSPLLYCPWVQLPREQVVIFALKMKYGDSYKPPAASGAVFADLTDPNYYATAWAEKAYADDLIQNCGTSGGKPLFCPKEFVTRGLGAYVIVRAKSLTMP